MTTVSVRELARHIDRMRRRTTPRRPGVVAREVPGGWLSARPNAAPGDYPSSSVNRVYWIDRDEPLSAGEIGAALAAARPLRLSRLYGWLAPWAWDEGAHGALLASGALPWPDLEYVALSREAAAIEPARASPVSCHVLRADELEGILGPAAGWYSDEGIACAKRLAADGISEIHAGFDGADVVALGTLTLEGDVAYLGAAGTRPDARGRGAQSALIAARVSRAAALGARWCCAETNTAVPISLRNLERAGFERRINWRVYWWDGPALACPAEGVAS